MRNHRWPQMAVKEYLGLGWILCLSQLTSAAVPLFTENGGVNLKSGYQDLYLAGLLPMTGKWPGGTAMMTAAKMALVRINSREDVLPKYRLNLVYGDTEFNVYKGAKLLHQLLSEDPIKIAVVGAANSELSEASGLMSELYNLVQISYASVSPTLSDKATFPRFFRTSSPDTLVNPARIAICEEFGWQKVAVLQQSRAVFDAVAEDLKDRIEAHMNMSLLASEVFQSDPEAAVKLLKKRDARIIFTICNVGEAQLVLCEAYKQGMIGKKYQWVMPGWFDDNWWKVESTDCTLEEMEKAAEGYMTCADLTLSASSYAGISGITSAEYWKEYNELTNYAYPHATNMAPMMYDALWALALALNVTETDLLRKGGSKTIKDFSYNDKGMADMIYTNLKSIRFEGVKSPIRFNDKQDPIIVVKIERVQDGVKQILGYYGRGISKGLEWSGAGLPAWEDGKPPADSTKIVVKKVFVPIEIYLLFSILAGLSIVIALFFLGINIRFRTTRIIKMSSPNINNIILLGCIIVYLTVFLQELDTSNVLIFCRMRSFALVSGFALAFGALFSKTWRIHIIFANKKLKRKVVKDSQLVIMIFALLILDLTVLVVWEIIDPPKLIMTEVSQQFSADGNTLTVYNKDQCKSENTKYFVYTLYAIQGLLLVFGAFLAWETKKVKIAALNDSQLIGVCIYNVFVLSIMGVVLSAVLSSQVTLSYCIMSTIVILATNTTACTIFVPKILKLREFKIFAGSQGEAEAEDSVKAYTAGTLKTTVSSQQVPSTSHGGDSSEKGCTCKNCEYKEKLEKALKKLEESKKQLEEKQRMTHALTPVEEAPGSEPTYANSAKDEA